LSGGFSGKRKNASGQVEGAERASFPGPDAFDADLANSASKVVPTSATKGLAESVPQIDIFGEATWSGLGIWDGGLAAEPLMREACNWCRVDADGDIGVPDRDVGFIQNSQAGCGGAGRR
jgi:hypothetical protein